MRAFLEAIGTLDQTLVQDRAAVMLSMYRIVMQGWSKDDALQELAAYPIAHQIAVN